MLDYKWSLDSCICRKIQVQLKRRKKKTNKFVRVRQRHIYLALFKQIQAYYTIFVTVLPVCG
uniref:Putative ovule protein n=1 Tax=Solanum chacoense TaxID=4108 RepID=A0A0V0I577_SOLCH